MRTVSTIQIDEKQLTWSCVRSENDFLWKFMSKITVWNQKLCLVFDGYSGIISSSSLQKNTCTLGTHYLLISEYSQHTHLLRNIF